MRQKESLTRMLMQRSRFGEFTRMTNLPDVMKHGTNLNDARIESHVKSLKLRQQLTRSLIH